MYRIEYTQRFEEELQDILDFISRDSITNALTFYDELMDTLSALDHFPYRLRQRNKDNKVIREMVVGGYTVPVLIDEKQNVVYMLGIFNRNIWE